MIIDGIDISDELNEAEARELLRRAPHGTYAIEAEPDGEWIDVRYLYRTDTPFERIRRITGYLVGDLGRFNDAKLSEVNDRVKHSI